MQYSVYTVRNVKSLLYILLAGEDFPFDELGDSSELHGSESEIKWRWILHFMIYVYWYSNLYIGNNEDCQHISLHFLADLQLVCIWLINVNIVKYESRQKEHICQVGARQGQRLSNLYM